MRFNLTGVAVALFAVFLVAPQPIQAGQALDQAMRASCRTEVVCVITDNPGGDVAVFQTAAQEIRSERKRLVIDGRCVSACVILADIARDNTCLTDRAEFAVHQSTTLQIVGKTIEAGRSIPVGKVISRQDPPQSADINAWVARHGGYPADGFMTISLADARQFWAMCD